MRFYTISAGKFWTFSLYPTKHSTALRKSGGCIRLEPGAENTFSKKKEKIKKWLTNRKSAVIIGTAVGNCWCSSAGRAADL